MNYSLLTLSSSNRPRVEHADWADPAGPGSDHCTRLLAIELMQRMQALYPKHAIVEVVGPLEVQARRIWGMLGYAPETANLDGRYTRWLDAQWAARSQMSALVPDALTELEHHPAWLDANCEGVVLCLPGTVWRRDLRDRTHIGAPRQMDVWVLNKPATRRMARAELLCMVDSIVEVVRPKGSSIAPSVIEAVHPYTERGIEVCVPWQGSLLELLEAGEISGDLLNAVGLADVHGLALGLGLDRGCMVRKKMLDIRGLVDLDPRALAQCKTLAPWKAWSAQPTAKRDLSLAIAEDMDAEQIVDAVASIVPQEVLQRVDVQGSWAMADIPLVAQERLGIQPGQRQWLLRMGLGWHDRTITTQEANAWSRLVWDRLHAGTAYDYRPEDTVAQGPTA